MLLPRHGEFLLCDSMPRAVPSADGVCPFRVLVSAKQGDWECAKFGLLEH
jgi:hypothetical protein